MTLDMVKFFEQFLVQKRFFGRNGMMNVEERFDYLSKLVLVEYRLQDCLENYDKKVHDEKQNEWNELTLSFVRQMMMSFALDSTITERQMSWLGKIMQYHFGPKSGTGYLNKPKKSEVVQAQEESTSEPLLRGDDIRRMLEKRFHREPTEVLQGQDSTKPTQH